MEFVLKLIFILAMGLTPVSIMANYYPSEEDADEGNKGPAEGEEKFPLVHHLSLTTGLNYVASSIIDDIREKVPEDELIKIHSDLPLNLRYSFSFTNPSIAHYLEGGYQGIALGVLNFGVAKRKGVSTSARYIGYPVMAYLFQGGPFFHFNDILSLNYEWNFGAAFGWEPYSNYNQNFNLTVGSRVNAYLNLNLYLRWELSSHLALFGGGEVSHFSNGNTSFPNPGINSFGLKIGMELTINPDEKSGIRKVSCLKGSMQKDTMVNKSSWWKRKVEYEIMAWGSTRKRVYRGGDEPVLLPGHFACAGISFSPMATLNKWWGAGVSLDLQYDHSAGMPKTKDKEPQGSEIVLSDQLPGIPQSTSLPGHPSFWHQVSAGLSVHGELRMPIFAVNVGIGCNFVAPWENRGTYQNIALKTYLCRRLFVNIGYQLRNFHQQSSLMLGAGLTLGPK